MTTAARDERADSGSTGRSLPQAVATALVLLGLIIVFNVLGPDAFFFLAAVVVALSLFEVLSALLRAGRRVNLVIGMASGVALFTVPGPLVEEPGLIVVVVAVAAYLSFIAGLMPGRSETPASDIAWGLLAVVWVAGGGAGATYILTLTDSGALLLTSYVLVTAANDIGGYFIGTWIGRHRIAPAISPKKTWEGWIGGLVASAVAGAGFGAALADLDVVHGVGLAVVASLIAPLGDLVASLFKRELGLKDMGSVLPGHGGMLDRIDGIVFAAPAAAAYLRFVVFG